MKNIGAIITLAIFLISIIIGAGKIIANVSASEKEIEKLKNKVEILTSATDKMDVKQEAIKEDIKEVDKKIDQILQIMLKKK